MRRKNAWSYGRVPLTLTFQKEVAERIVAPPRNSQRCRLSLMCQAWCDVDLKFIIKGNLVILSAVIHFMIVMKIIVTILNTNWVCSKLFNLKRESKRFLLILKM